MEVDDSSVFRRLILSQLVNRSGSNDFIKTPLHSTRCFPETSHLPISHSNRQQASNSDEISFCLIPLDISSYFFRRLFVLEKCYISLSHTNFYYVIYEPCIIQHSGVYIYIFWMLISEIGLKNIFHFPLFIEEFILLLFFPSPHEYPWAFWASLLKSFSAYLFKFDSITAVRHLEKLEIF